MPQLALGKRVVAKHTINPPVIAASHAQAHKPEDEADKAAAETNSTTETKTFIKLENVCPSNNAKKTDQVVVVKTGVKTESSNEDIRVKQEPGTKKQGEIAYP